MDEKKQNMNRREFLKRLGLGAGHPLHERRLNLQGFTAKAWNDFYKDGCNHQKTCGESAASENKWTITVNALRVAKTRSQPRATETSIPIPSLGLFDTNNPVYDPTEEEFRRRMQKKKKRSADRDCNDNCFSFK